MELSDGLAAVKTDMVDNKAYRYMICTLSRDRSKIELVNTAPLTATFDDFKAGLTQSGQPRVGVYGADGSATIQVVPYIPETTPASLKTLYSKCATTLQDAIAPTKRVEMLKI